MAGRCHKFKIPCNPLIFIELPGMNTNFFKELLDKHEKKAGVPPSEIISAWALHLICLMYPELSLCSYSSIEEIKDEYKKFSNM